MGSSQSHHLELVSFELCPYVQRSVITLLHKKVDFKITYIDLENPPAWFEKMSPLGKVPLLIVRETETEEPTVLFESAVINEYIDEVSPPMVMPSNPLEKAFERAWIAVGGELLMTMYPMMVSKDLAEIEEAKKEIFEILEKLEAVVTEGPFFAGAKFSLVDSSYAPFFMRMTMLKPMRDAVEWKKLPNIKKWAETLSHLESVKHSVKPDFKEKYVAMIKTRGSAWADQIS